MGASNVKQSENFYNNQQRKFPVDTKSYILGKHRATTPQTATNQLNNNFNNNKLNFIRDAKPPWTPLLTSDQSRSASVLKLPAIVNNQTVLRELKSPSSDPLSNMLSQNRHKCDQCGIVFPSDEALHKHKARFCIGVKDSGIGREPIYSDDEDIDDNKTNYPMNGYATGKLPARKIVQHETPRKKKQQEVNEWKLQRSIGENADDGDDQVSIFSQKYLNNIKTQDEIFNEILVEYERLQRKEQYVIRQMYDFQIGTTSVSDRNTTLRQVDIPSDNQNGRFEELQRRNSLLEEERRLLQEKLEELISSNYQPQKMSNYDPYRLLREMKEQQELNEKALDFLRERLIYASGVHDAASLSYANNRFRRTVGDNVRNSLNDYLKSGGHDASIIAKYSDLEYKLNSYQDPVWNKDNPELLKPANYQADSRMDPLAEGLKSVNKESVRLQTELEEMHKKFHTLSSRTRQLELTLASSRIANPTDHFNPYSLLNSSSYQPAVRDINNDQSDAQKYGQQGGLSTLDKRITPRSSPALSLLASNMNPLRNPLHPQVYDPKTGFVIFFDFILNMPSKIETCTLITSIHHPKSQLGTPSPLPSLPCEDFIDEKTNQRLRTVIVATKQPVPSCPPQQALTIVIEVQTSTNKGAPVESLETNAWTKFPLFDNRNRLSSGRWKVPLKAMPLEYHENLAVINKLPNYERAELYYRLVNAHDADEQTSAPISAKFREYYTYPIQYRN